MKLSEYVMQVVNDPKYGGDPEWVRLNLRRGHLERIEAAHDAEVREAERERAALHAEEGYRMEERCDDIAHRIRSGEPAEISARPRVVAEEPDVADLRAARAETWDEAISAVFAWWSTPENARPAAIVNPYGLGVPVKQEGAEQ